MLSESLKSIWIDSANHTEVFMLNIEEISSSEIADAYFLMDEERKTLCDKLKFEEDKYRCIAADHLARCVLSEKSGIPPERISFGKNKNGKPEFINGRGHFNISHSGKYLVLAFNENREVGIDIEFIKPVKTGMITRVCSDDELSFVLAKNIIPAERIDDINILNRFFKVWTYKEAFLKCIGIGIRAELKEIVFDENCYCEICDGYALCVVTSEN